MWVYFSWAKSFRNSYGVTLLMTKELLEQPKCVVTWGYNSTTHLLNHFHSYDFKHIIVFSDSHWSHPFPNIMCTWSLIFCNAVYCYRFVYMVEILAHVSAFAIILVCLDIICSFSKVKLFWTSGWWNLTDTT